MNREELLHAMNDIATLGETRALTDDELANYGDLEAALKAFQATDELRARNSAYNTAVSPIVKAVAAKGGDVEKRAFENYLRTGIDLELRAQSIGTPSEGGYLVNEIFRDKLVERQISYGGLANVAEQVTTDSGAPMSWPVVADWNEDAATITAEAAAFTTGGDIVFDQDNLNVFKYTTEGAGNLPLRVSVEMLQDAGFDVSGYVAKVFADRLARLQATHFATGTGSGQPLGLIYGDTDIEVDTWNYAALLEVESTLDPAYLDGASWIMHSSTWAAIRGMQDLDDRPLLLDGQGVSGSSISRTLLGYNVVIDNSFPAFGSATGNYAAFGRLRDAYVVRRLTNGITVVVDPYARKANGEVEYVGYQRVGGTVQDPNAYVTIGKTEDSA
jgi:HK97 family phage major capsid protein